MSMSVAAVTAASRLPTSYFRVKASSSSSSSSSTSSPRWRIRRPQNVDGDFFVDNTCIDCDTCRWMAPGIFNRQDGMSAVFKQPSSAEERVQALQALLSCPTSSIHADDPPDNILEVHKTFPIPIDEVKIQGVYHCGYHSEKSYGAVSYLMTRTDGNILIDSPRYTARLASKIKEMGGARYMFLTHKDDVADHDKWAKELGCTRILHSEDVCVTTDDVEIKLEGNGPWDLGSDVTLIHTPGHTAGSVCLFDKIRKVLFTGDHLLIEEFGLSILDKYNWFSGGMCNLVLNHTERGSRKNKSSKDSANLPAKFEGKFFLQERVPMQLKCVQKLLELDFEWILPGHGQRANFRDAEEKNLALRALLAAKGAEA